MDTYTVIGIIVFVVIILAVLRILWRLGEAGQRIFHLLFTAFTAGTQQEPQPRSLNGYEPTLLPLIRRDFPDYDPVMAKNQVRDYLNQQFGKRPEFRIHNVVIARYLNDGLQKTIVYQAAVCWRKGSLQQRRYDIFSSYLLPQGNQAVAANCPNCGATLGFGAVECAYCGSRVANPMGQHWEFTQITES